jgi:hypothetical protein
MIGFAAALSLIAVTAVNRTIRHQPPRPEGARA